MFNNDFTKAAAKKMQDTVEYLAAAPRRSYTLFGTALGWDTKEHNHPLNFTRINLNRAGRTVERTLTIGGIFAAVSMTGAGVTALGLCALAKAGGVALGKITDKSAVALRNKLRRMEQD